MAYSSDPYAAYSRANETKSPAEQIFMLYCGAISFVQQAKEAHKENNHNTRYQLIDRTMQIMRGLRVCLDYEANNKVATALNKYYEDIDTMLIAIQCEDEKEEICDRVIENLRAVKDTWEAITPNIASTFPDEDSYKATIKIERNDDKQEDSKSHGALITSYPDELKDNSLFN